MAKPQNLVVPRVEREYPTPYIIVEKLFVEYIHSTTSKGVQDSTNSSYTISPSRNYYILLVVL